MKDAKAIELSGELWGLAPNGSDTPQVQAYMGALPDGKKGIEFVTRVRPTPGTAPWEARWRPGTDGVRTEGDHAKISVRVTRNTQTP